MTKSVFCLRSERNREREIEQTDGRTDGQREKTREDREVLWNLTGRGRDSRAVAKSVFNVICNV